MNTLKKLLVAVVLATAVVFTASACGEEFTDNYATLLSPTVSQQDYDSYTWNVVDGATGYVVEINGEQKGIGNPIVENIMYGKYCEYVIDTETLGLGVHTVRFASYKFDAKTGTTLSDWSKEFYVVNELPETIGSITITNGEVSVDGVYANSIELVFNDSIVATYTSPDKAMIHSGIIGLDEFTFSAELLELVNYDVKAYAVNSFGKSENYCSTQFFNFQKPTIGASKGYLVDGEALFLLPTELVNPLVTLKMNDIEFTVALTGNYEKVNLNDILNFVSIEDFKVIFETIIKQDCTFSLKVLNAEGYVSANEYSNEVIVKAKGQAFVDGLAKDGVVDALGMYVLVRNSWLEEIFEDSVTTKVTVTVDDGTVKEVPVLDEILDQKYYDVASALGFGFNVIKVEQQISIAGFQSTAELFNYVLSINSQVKSVSLSSNSVTWSYNGITDGYKVQILDAFGTVKNTFETTTKSWKVDEYHGSGAFSVKIIPVLNGVDGVASPALKIEKNSVVPVSVIKEDLGSLYVEGDDANVIKVELYQTNGEEVLVQSQTLNSSTQKMIMYKSSLFELGTFEIRLKKLGNGINTVDSNENVAKFAVSDCLTFDVKDGETIKVSGVDVKEMVINGKLAESEYFDKQGWFNIKEYYTDLLLQDEYATTVTIGKKLSAISSSSINIIVKTISFNMTSNVNVASTPAYVVYKAEEKEFTWQGNSYSEYAYEIKNNASGDVKASGIVKGTKLAVSSLTTGTYTIKIKLLGNGQVLNSFWKEFTFEVLSAATSVYTKTNTEFGGTYLHVKVSSPNVVPVLFYSKNSYSSYLIYEGENDNEYYFELNSSAARNDTPYLTYSYNDDTGCDYHSSIEKVSKEIRLTGYQIYSYNYNYGSSYKSFFTLKNESVAKPFLNTVLVKSNNNYILGTSLVKDDGVGDYDYRYDYLIDTSYYPTSSFTYGAFTAYRITINYDKATGYEGVATSRYYTNETQEKVKINYVYVYSKTVLNTYLTTNVPLPSGYAYYSDAECTQLLEATEITSATTVYVGVAQA